MDLDREKLHREILNCGKTFKEFAREADLTVPALVRICSGMTINPRDSTIDLIRQALGYDEETFNREFKVKLERVIAPRYIDREKLRREILRRYGTIKAFAKVSGLSAETVRVFLNGCVNTRDETIDQIRKTLGYGEAVFLRIFYSEDGK